MIEGKSGRANDTLSKGECIRSKRDGLAIALRLPGSQPLPKITLQPVASGVDSQAESDHEPPQGVEAADVGELVQQSRTYRGVVGLFQEARVHVR